MLHSYSSADDAVARRGSVAGSRGAQDVGSVVAKDGGQLESEVLKHGGSSHGERE